MSTIFFFLLYYQKYKGEQIREQEMDWPCGMFVAEGKSVLVFLVDRDVKVKSICKT